MIAYLERYAETFELPVELNSPGAEAHSRERAVRAGGRPPGGSPPSRSSSPPAHSRNRSSRNWRADSSRTSSAAQHGLPQTLGRPEGTVLVVGGGNTGSSPRRLSSTLRVVLAVGSRQTPLPQRLLGRDLFWWLTKTRLFNTTVESRLGPGSEALIGSSRGSSDGARGAETPRCRRRGPDRPLRGRERAGGRRSHLGDRVPARVLLDRPPRLRPGQAPPTPPRRHRRARPLLPWIDLAAHAWLGADRLGQGRCRVHRRADRGPSRRSASVGRCARDGSR